MKKIVLILTFMVSLLRTGYSQETITSNQDKIASANYKNSIRLLPLSALYGEINFEYEHILKNNFSLLLQAYGDFSNTDVVSNGTLVPESNITAYEIGLEIGGRYYFSKRKNAPKGWFIGAGIIGGYKEVDYNASIFNPRDYNTVMIGGSIKGGYQWVFKSGFTIGAANRIQYTQELSGPMNTYIDVLPEISIGYSW
ncbi:DUF3575 domain-containing protein [Aquimarina sp. MMG015]|uniref:DUF3575 domain-containing protein n=1 Tax=Aquimarina sp. MMG015 TaxID=2822689 RepID=UPI001B3A404D|nr:DUF3575 domain-containing protein [Aquimarina sp. MMG015]MBQ4802669.1 DUF3575 domain-containing protein [Aquimarina sp. MMG015]